MHRLHLGPQVLTIVLGRHESVRLTDNPEASTSILHSRANTLLGETRQPILADEVQTFKALITIHKVLQEGHPIAVREAQANTAWLESLARGVSGDGMRGEETVR